MKTILLTMLGIIFSFIVILLIFYLIIRTVLNKCGFASYSLMELFKTISEARKRNLVKPKQVTGMTKVHLPTIQNDFNDFNLNEFYNKTEEHIRRILTSIEKKKISILKSKDYDLIRDKIDFQVRDLTENDISYHYNDIIFHKHAIKSYQNSKGMVKLEISTALEYYYEKIEHNKVVEKSEYKKQTRYTTTYIYIYDTIEAGFDIGVLGLNCPNCGSPISSFESKVCSYCKSGFNIQVASLLKCWKIINIKEDY